MFVCDACRSAHHLPVGDFATVACCEVCGVARGDWSYKHVALTGGTVFSRPADVRRAALLRKIAEADFDLRRAASRPSPAGPLVAEQVDPPPSTPAAFDPLGCRP